MHLPRFDPDVAHPFSIVTAAKAYATATAVHRARLASSTEGFRLYWMSGDFFGSRSVRTEPNAFLVVGRHTQCDVELRGDPTVALRHVLVRCVVLDDGCACLAILDLHSADGFELSDGTRQRAVIARGPLVFRLGAHVLVALPSDGPLPKEMPQTRVSPLAGHPYRGMVASIGSDPIARPRYVTHVTLLPAPAALHDAPFLATPAEAPCGRNAQPAPLLYEVVLQSAAGRARVCLTGQDLDQGVLVGRSDRCVDAGLRAVLNQGISRVHVLLLRGRDGCVAYDVASSQGTRHRGKPIRCVTLSDFGTELMLAESARVVLRWRMVF